MVEDLFMRYKNGYVTFDRMVVLSKIKMFKIHYLNINIFTCECNKLSWKVNK